jgi:1,4-alpha-glucan branching enzyme
MYAHPGKKLLFMGCEFGQRREWNHDASLDWHLLDDPRHAGLRRLVRDLNGLHRTEPALHRRDHDPRGFEWIDCHDVEQSTLSFLRRDADEDILVVCNFTPVPRTNFRVGVPRAGHWRELLNSDASDYGGAGFGNFGGVDSTPVTMHDRNDSVSLTLPPLGVIFLKLARTVSA